MTDLQRTLRLAWVAADKQVSHLISTKPVFADDQRIEDYRAATHDWREEWNQALGFRDGLRSACVLAGVPNFTE